MVVIIYVLLAIIVILLCMFIYIYVHDNMVGENPSLNEKYGLRWKIYLSIISLITSTVFVIIAALAFKALVWLFSKIL